MVPENKKDAAREGDVEKNLYKFGAFVAFAQNSLCANIER